MLDLSAWVARIDTNAVPASMAAALDSVEQGQRLPGLVLVPGRERVDPARMSQGARHRVVGEVLVVSGVRRGNQAMGGATVDDLAEIRRPMLANLIGWEPPGCDEAVVWHGGRLLKLSSHALSWVDVLVTEYWWTP